MRKTGTYQALGGLRYFIPHPLPPKNPPLELNAELLSLYGQASFALGQLEQMGTRLPNINRFIRSYVIKEALLSSAIEGVHTTLVDLFTQSLSESKPDKDTQLVLNYTKALEAALQMMQKQGVPLSLRVIRKAHEVLMSEGHGERANPGNYRKQSVRVGDLVPPAPTEVPNLMEHLESYIHANSELPDLIRTGLVHVKFETIHPFLDGNGRIGRLLIVLMLIETGLLKAPILYPSYFFNQYRTEYYHKLDAVRTKGDFEGWTIYYLRAIKVSALDGLRRARDIEILERDLKNQIQTAPQFVKMRDNAETVLEFLFSQPVTSIAQASHRLSKAYNTIASIMQRFVQLGVVSETPANKRKRLYRFEPYLALLEKEYPTISF